MFGSLKKHMKKSLKSLVEKIKKEGTEEEEIKEKAKKPEKRVKKPIIKKVKKPKKETPKEKPETKEPEPEKIEKPVEEEAVEEKEEPEETQEKEGLEEIKEEIEGISEEKPKLPEPEKRGLIARLRRKVIEKTLTEKDIDNFFSENEVNLLQSNVALGVIDALKKNLKDKLAEKPIKRTQAGEFIYKSFEDSLFEIVDQGEIDLDKTIKQAKKEGRTACFVFLGFNGSGKTLSIAKTARYLINKGYKPVLAAGDTFRAASIEQLEHHGKRIGAKVIKHKYGSDSAAVVFDARKYAEAKGCDVVLADTAGRTHIDTNLMDELKKVVRVNNPDLKILVVDSLTGNDAVEQAERFNEAVGVDTVILTKIDVDEKGGSILSVSYAIKKPVLFLGTGQNFEDLRKFEPKRFVKELLE